MSANPYKPDSPDDTESADTTPVATAYNLVSDTVTGLNMRKSDNKFQAIFILVSALSLALVFAILAALNPGWDLPWFAGALAGGFIGLVFGLFASGIYLMIYRGVRHLQGKHD